MTRIVPAALVIAALAACENNDDGNRIVGQMESDRIEITAEFAEPIIERAVTEGEQVSAGQLLIVQDTTRIDARLGEAEASLAEARARLDELIRGPREEQIVATRASVDGARRALEFREVELQRAAEIYAMDLSSPERCDRAQAARDDAAANLENLEARLDELLSGTTAEELRQAEATVSQAEARVAQLSLDRERHSAVASEDALVDRFLFEPGERPPVGRPVAILLSGRQAYARVFVPAALRLQVQPGTEATIYVDGLAEPLPGIVRWVSSEAAFTPYFALTEEDRGRLTYAAKIDIVRERGRIPDGVPVEVELHISGDVE